MSMFPSPDPTVKRGPTSHPGYQEKAPPDPQTSDRAGHALLVRVSIVRRHGMRHNIYVTIEGGPNDSDVDLFTKAIREFRYRHGYVESIAAIDLLPNS